ncbi:MAG: hypothetical protein ACTHMS_13220 [Jatrophihabitans sp.]|uniref:hypothetical protein n=1 Tax=Jatrophihabitans sp. TaxID=1932789 RepID=UPI003F7F1A23
MVLAVPNPATYSPGELIAAALLNAQVRDAVSFLLNPPLFLAVLPGNQAIASGGSGSALSFTSGVVVDTYNGHSNTTNPTRYTPQAPGYYEITGQIAWTNNATGYRQANIAQNGVAQWPLDKIEAVSSTDTIVVQVLHPALYFNGTTDYVELFGSQSSGASLNALGSFSSFSARWVHA